MGTYKDSMGLVRDSSTHAIVTDPSAMLSSQILNNENSIGGLPSAPVYGVTQTRLDTMPISSNTTVDTGGSMFDFLKDDGKFSMGGTAGLAMGGLNVGLGIADYLAKKPLYEQSLKNAKQTYATNQLKVDEWQKGKRNTEQAFAAPTGLAATKVS